ncbi:hypothetical protein [Flagellimonas sp.]|uniref:hypothetical protein n=1 Tax=Flagellimonas sp. TaxID=2058762 RepID=UPI003BAA479B
MRNLIYIFFFASMSLMAQTDPSTLPLDLDGIQNGDETGIDCGGSTGRPCVNGRAVKAFPGAEGAGKYAVGARGAANPTVHVVTNENLTGSGAFMDGFDWSGSGNATGGEVFVVFQVGCTIDYAALHPAMTGHNITIFGQTAPPDSGGVVLSNGAPDWRNTELIVQDIQIEMGDHGYRDENGDLTGVPATNQSDALSVYLAHNVIFDHCRIAYGVDENATMSNSTNVTFQHLLVHHALNDAGHGDGGSHSMNGILDRSDDGSPTGGRYSYLYNYGAYNSDRNMRSAKSIFEMHNNVFFEFFGQSTFGSGQSFSLIGNSWVKSPDQEIYNGATIAQSNDATHGYGGKVYVSDNIRNHSTNVFYHGNYTSQGVFVANPEDTFFTNPPLWPSSQVNDSVLAHAGPRLHKAPIHLQVIDDFNVGSLGFIDSQWETGGFTDSAPGTPWPDVDADGMDDDWEDAFIAENSLGITRDALDPVTMVPSVSNEYYPIELWAHSLVGDVASGPISVTGITWDNDTQTVNVGGFLDLSYTFAPGNATDKGFSLSSSNVSVVSDTGAVVGEGSATLTITADDGGHTDVMAITVIPAVENNGNGVGSMSKLAKIID